MLKTLFAIDDEIVPLASAAPRLSNAEAGAEWAARASMYRLLSGVFVEEPGQAFVQAIRRPEVLENLAGLGLHFDADFTAPDDDVLLDQLACEYTTLFVASGGFPPVESVRLTGRYKQEPHFKVEQAYAKWGLALQKGRFEVFPDQLGVELMFLAELLERCSVALERNDEATFRRIEREVRRFWAQHLGRWVRGYAQLIERAAENSFYREMATLLNGFACGEIAALGLRIDDLDHGRAVVPKTEIRVEFNPEEPVCNGCESAPMASGREATMHTLHDLR